MTWKSLPLKPGFLCSGWSFSGILPFKPSVHPCTSTVCCGAMAVLRHPCLHCISTSVYVDGKEQRCSGWSFSGILPFKTLVHPCTSTVCRGAKAIFRHPCLYCINASMHVDGKERRCSGPPFSGIHSFISLVRLIPNRLINWSSSNELKIQFLRCFQSQ